MTLDGVLSRFVLSAALLITAALATTASGQSFAPLHSAVDIRKVPALQRQVLPGDVDGDGHVDMIGGAGNPITLHLARGHGDGSFGPALSLGVAGEPAAMADIDGDGRLDLVARQSDGVVVLEGRGDGTFLAPRLLHPEPWGPSGPVPFHFALVADFDGDGRADIAIPSHSAATAGLLLFPGNGDLTFGAPMHIPMASGPAGAAVGDFTGNGRLDIAATEVCCSVTILRNDGGLLFTQSQITMAGDLTGIAAGDIDGNGDVDLVVAEFFDWGFPFTETNPTAGQIAVLLGNGDGTFQPAARYESGVRGETAVVLGDFTRDGVMDVATGNRSYFRHDDLGIQMWDSVTIFKGTGTGTLEEPLTFALDTGGILYDPSPYAATLHHMTSADVDGDGHLDLVTSPAAVVLTRPAPARNTPPTVFAGHNRTELSDNPIVLQAHGHDPDHHWLRYEWWGPNGRIGTSPAVVPSGFQTGLPPGTYTFTVTVDDGHGGAGSDTVTIVVIDQELRFGVSSDDIGSASPAGSTSYDAVTRTFTIRGAGADIWGSADAFHYQSTPIVGNFRIVARVASIEHVHRWTKAGLMIRETPLPGSRHVSIFATPTAERPVAFQRRTTTGGPSVHTDGAFVGPPVWLALTRMDDEITAQYRIQDGDPWITLGTERLPQLHESVMVGLAVTSHVHGRLATATFSDVLLEALGRPTFASRDIGTVGAPGSGTIDHATATAMVTGSGADIWGTADAFHYLYQPFSGSFQIVTRVASVDAVHRWTKAGLMIRETLDPDARHASVFATPTTERPVAFQRRSLTGGDSVHADGPFLAPPVWLALSRIGDEIRAHYRVDGSPDWIALGSQTLPGLPHSVFVGFAVTSHADGRLATARFEEYRIRRIDEPEAPGFTTQDIGAVSAAGDSSISSGVFTVRGSGADIWGTADAFHYLHRQIAGDFQIVVRATSVDPVHRWTKAGLMIRETLDTGSRHASVFATPTSETPVAFQRRSATDGPSVHTGGAFVGPPVWLALSRTGDRITAHYRLTAAGDWIPIGSQTLAGLPRQVYVGLAVTSHDDGTLATATFDSMQIAGGP